MSNSQPENNSVTKDEYGRRTWDKEAYLARAHQRGLNEEFPFDTDERRKIFNHFLLLTRKNQ